MALIYCTGFDRGTSLSLYNIYNQFGVSITSEGRTGNCLRLSPFYPDYYSSVKITITGADYSELVCGFAVKFAGNINWKNIIQFANNSSQVNVALGRNAGNRNLAIILRDSEWYWVNDIILLDNTWYYIEIKTKFHNTNGYVIVKVNGVEVFNQTGLNTAYSSSILSSRHLWMYTSYDYTYYDDLYVCDTSGTKNNDFLGDISVKTLFPTSDGTYNDFSVVGATNRYEAVDETSPNGDIDYITESGSGLKQTFGFTAPSIEGSILGIVHNAVMRKDGTSEFVRLLAKYNTTLTSGDLISLSDSYVNYRTIYQTRLGSSEDWSINDLNSLELGVMIE